MANAVDQLFNSILPKLGVATDLDWSDIPKASPNTYDLDEPVDSAADRVHTLNEEEIRDRTSERIAGGRTYPEIAQETREAIEGGIRIRGFETLAFFKSRRFISARPFCGRWGIFYIKQGLEYVESQIQKTYPTYDDPRKLALIFLRKHERFHYKADLQALMFEATLGKHLYMPLHKALRGRRSHFVEEALANRDVWDWASKQATGLEEFARDFMLLQPNAYARFEEPRLSLAAEWVGTVVDQMPPGSVSRFDLAHWVEATPLKLLRSSLCPEYVIYPGDVSNWFPSALVLPPVKSVQDGKNVVKLLRGRLAHLEHKWVQTKTKLLENRLLPGLNLKPWPEDGPDRYSVRVDDNFRAHLHHTGAGQWLAYVVGPHKKLRHG